ncbi:MAG: PQQ-dependent sugar dehydrogenase [Dehalococcoidia bacterium]|nr:PQQ-dependent sugar dehydrogenase [Dehalococcoidia bacterium]
MAVSVACQPGSTEAPQATPFLVTATPTERGNATQSALAPSPAATGPLPSPTVRTAPTATPTAAPQRTPAPTPNPNPTLDVQAVYKGLQTPWAMDFAPDGRIFLTERPGRIRVVKDGQLQAAPWMTLTVAETGEGGLLGLALDKQFAQNGFIYVAYTYRNQGGNLLNRLVRLHEDPATGKGAQDQVLLDGVAGGQNHDGGRVKIGPDGKLYWTMGETFSGSLAQDLKSLNGKILRLNTDGSIPADNPFPNSPIYTYGNRNPQGLAWQPGTGRLYETEHGPSGEKGCCQDEVNFIEPGKNYGWPAISGDQTRAGMETPIQQSGATVTWAPSGAAFVTGGPWAGSLLFVGLRGLALYRIILDPNDPRKVLSFQPYLQNQYGRLRDVAQGPDGAIYILTSNRDGRGSPVADDDRVLRLTFK